MSYLNNFLVLFSLNEQNLPYKILFEKQLES